ncbi:MAG: PSP1 domain-containing protein [Candidatus Woesearchaeota archaeon]
MELKKIGIAFRPIGEIYYINEPKDFNIATNDGIIVRTQRGVEYGEVVKKTSNQNVKQSNYIKEIIRPFEEGDLEQLEKNYEMAAKAHIKIKELIKDHNLDMKILDTEYLFDGEKVIFTFTSNDRVDFRDLLKELAYNLKTKIELKQVGARDASKIIGGLGPCGRVVCCANHLREFNSVSIKMAKTQNMSLSPENINGTCNRLMCCLEYENNHYSEALKKAPSINSTVKTPEGKAKVVYRNLLKKTASVKFEQNDITTIKDYKFSDLEYKNNLKEKKGCNNCERGEK